MPVSVRICLVGLGAVNRTLLEIIVDKQRVLDERYGVKFKVVGACDSSGARSCDDGFDISRLVAIKKSKGHLSGCDQGVVVEGGAVTLSASCEYDVLIDGSPCGVEPGMSCVKNALQRGRHAVLANKAPLVHGAFSELHTLAQTK
jgi:homoserine dehydrogenase